MRDLQLALQEARRIIREAAQTHSIARIIAANNIASRILLDARSK